MVITSKVLGGMGQNLVWHSFLIIDTLSVPNYKEIGRGHVKFMMIQYRVDLLLFRTLERLSILLEYFNEIQYSCV